MHHPKLIFSEPRLCGRALFLHTLFLSTILIWKNLVSPCLFFNITLHFVFGISLLEYIHHYLFKENRKKGTKTLHGKE